MNLPLPAPLFDLPKEDKEMPQGCFVSPKEQIYILTIKKALVQKQKAACKPDNNIFWFDKAIERIEAQIDELVQKLLPAAEAQEKAFRESLARDIFGHLEKHEERMLNDPEYARKDKEFNTPIENTGTNTFGLAFIRLADEEGKLKK